MLYLCVLNILLISAATAQNTLTMPATTTSLDGNIALTCTFEGLAEGNMKWYLDNVVIESGDKTVIGNTELISNTAEFTLRIYDVNPEDNAGTYQCRMNFEDTDEIVASSEVTVRKASVISAQGDVISTILVSDGVLTAKCLMEGDKVPDDVEWYAGSSKIIFDGTTKIMNTNTKQLVKSIKYFSNITLKEFEFADSETYRCVFKFTDASEAEASVSVDYATVANVGCVSLDYSSTADVTLTCTYNGKAAATGVTFTLPDSTKEVGTLGGFTAGADPEINAGSQDGTYTLSGVTNDMDGSYSCEFTIDSGFTLSARQQLTARKTEITTSIGPLILNLIVRSSVTLTCSVAGGAKTVKWYKDATELGSADYKTVSTPSNPDVLILVIKLTIADDSAGTYKCEAIQYDDICTDEQKFSSAGVALEVIDDVPTTQPLSATVLEGTNHELTVEFPNPFGDTAYAIVWSFEGKPMTGGNVYSNGYQIIDGSIVNENSISTISTSLSITKISKEAAGSYTCTIKWKTIHIKSDVAVLKVPHISVPPSTTNVVSGSAAVFTCAVTADTAATSINLHQSSDDAITGTPVSTMSGTTVTSIITLTGVTSASKGSYYCKATWAAGTITSDPVYLSVLELKSDEIETTVWGVVDKMAEFECKSDAMLMESNVDAYLDATSKQKVYADVDLSWTFNTDGSIWKPISDESRFAEKLPLVDVDGVRVNGLNLRGIVASDDGMTVKCTISYIDDAANHFIGGAVESVAIALKIASITSFSVSNADPIAGDTITFTCVASGKEEPTFTFATKNNVFDASRFTELSIPPVTTSGTTYTAKYETKIIIANPTGQQVTCTTDYGLGKGKDKASVTVNTFYDCSAVPFKQLGGTTGTITATAGSGESAGSLTQSVECPADTATVKYSLAVDTENAENTITCDKSTGQYTSMFLSPCELKNAFTSGFKEQRFPIVDGAKFCDESSEETYSIANLNTILKAQNDVCGFYPHVPCLTTTTEVDKCTLDTEKSGCYFDNSTQQTHIQMFVDFTTPTFSISAKKARMNWESATIRFWNCTGSRKRRAASDFDNESFLNQPTNETIRLSGVTDDSPQLVIVGTAAAACAVAIMAVFTYLVLYRRQKQAVHSAA